MHFHSTSVPLELTYGIEEEFFLIDPATRDLPSKIPPAFLRACRIRLGERVGEELLQPQVEATTPILRSTVEARDSLTHLRASLGELAALHGLGLVAAGTHPFAAWDAQRPTDKLRYERLIDEFQIVGRRNLFCGLHVHVGVPEGHDRIDVMNRLMRWLPVLLALSTSSPFWNGRATGLMSYRQAAYDEWPRSGIPDAFTNEAEYDSFVRLLASCGALRDGSYLWWAIRPSARYPTLELRIADACTHVDDALALAAVFRCLVRAHLRQPSLGVESSAGKRRLIDANRWRAKRYGTDAEFIDETSGCVNGFLSTLDEMQRLVAPDARALGCEQEIQHLRAMVLRGTSAQSQLAVYAEARQRCTDRSQALSEVVDWLARTTHGAGTAAQRDCHQPTDDVEIA
jgi:carboxylate-amine ligase